LFAGSLAQHATDKGPLTVKFVVSDYRRVDGVLFPYRSSVAPVRATTS